MDEKSLEETLKTTLDIWKFQVDSYWSRNSYFVTFHTAIMAAVWEISKPGITAPRRVAAECFCFAGMILSILWLANNIRVHQYILYWWNRAASIERLLNRPDDACLVFGYDRRRGNRFKGGDYHLWMNSIPIIFFVLWVLIFIVCF